MKLFYAGIGSRETPSDVLGQMRTVGSLLAASHVLRSGHADGADKAFEEGCVHARGAKEIYLPWPGFNGAPRNSPDHIVPEWCEALFMIAAQYHPRWGFLNQGIRKLHARNVCQILGKDLQTPVAAVLCWTPGGKSGGGTGQAIRIARDYAIPVYDFAIRGNLDKALTHLQPQSTEEYTCLTETF